MTTSVPAVAINVSGLVSPAKRQGLLKSGFKIIKYTEIVVALYVDVYVNFRNKI